MKPEYAPAIDGVNYDPFNCPKCGAHDYGLLAPQIGDCPHCLKKDAERYRWLKAKYDGVDFDYCDEGRVALIFDVPKDIRVSADLDATIDRQIAVVIDRN